MTASGTFARCTCRAIYSSNKPISSSSIPLRKFATTRATFEDRNTEASTSALSKNESTSRTKESLSWFVDPSTAPLPPKLLNSTSPDLAPVSAPLSAPPHLPLTLIPLFEHLAISPFLDRNTLTFIDARRADPDSWTDWIVLSSLKKGREKGLKGAIEGIREFLAKNPVVLSPAPPRNPFAPALSSPIITGLPSSPSKHSRSRSKQSSLSSRSDQSTGWAMLDAGDVVVHVMTAEGRRELNLEKLWDVIEKVNERERASTLESEEDSHGQVEVEEEGEVEEMTEEEIEIVRKREANKVYD